MKTLQNPSLEKAQYEVFLAKFICLYSEKVEKPLNGELTVDDLKKRIDDFIMASCVPVDLYCDPDKPMNLYAVIQNQEDPSLQKLVHFKGYDVYDEQMFQDMNSMDFPSSVAVVHLAKEKELMMYTRTLKN